MMVSNVRRVSGSHKIGDRFIASAQVAGMVATGWFVWIHNVRPRLGFESLAGQFGEALLYVALSWICGTVVMGWVYFVAATADPPRAVRFSLMSTPQISDG